MHLLVPVRERMGGGSDHRQSVFPGDVADAAAQAAKVLGGFADRGADLRANLDLGTEELRGDLLTDTLPALVEDGRGRVAGKIPAARVDQ